MNHRTKGENIEMKYRTKDENINALETEIEGLEAKLEKYRKALEILSNELYR